MSSPKRSPLHSLILVTGAARSGKSQWAEERAKETGLKVIYIATASVDPKDKEWQERIKSHQTRRPENWIILEVPIELSQNIQAVAQPENCLLIDSLGTWVANLLKESEEIWYNYTERLIKTLQASEAQIIIVAEETGWGVVPAYSSGRLFRDRLGSLIRSLGMIADTVYLVVAGYAICLSDLGQCLKDPNN